MQYIDSGLLGLALFDNLLTCHARHKAQQPLVMSTYTHTVVWCALALVAHVVLG